MDKKKRDIDKQIGNIIGNVYATIDAGVRNVNYEYISAQIAAKILGDAIRQVRYNDYSGNLTRSFFCYISINGENYMFLCNPNVANKPDVETRETAPYSDLGQFSPRKGTGTRRFVKMYLIQKKRHKHTYKGRPVRNKRENRGMPREVTTYKAHRYSDEIPKRRSALISTYSGIAVGNYTPYRRFVEAKGYRVIGGGNRSRWIAFAEKLLYKGIAMSIKQMAYTFNKGTKQKWTDSSGIPYYYGGKYGQTPIGKQPSRYLSPRRNAGVGGGYGYWRRNENTGKTEWIQKDIYPRN